MARDPGQGCSELLRLNFALEHGFKESRDESNGAAEYRFDHNEFANKRLPLRIVHAKLGRQTIDIFTDRLSVILDRVDFFSLIQDLPLSSTHDEIANELIGFAFAIYGFYNLDMV